MLAAFGVAFRDAEMAGLVEYRRVDCATKVQTRM